MADETVMAGTGVKGEARNEPKPMTDTPVGWTSGPWFLAEDDKHHQAVVRNEHIEVATCWHHSVGAIEVQMRANSHLIAASPCLAEAVAEALSHCGPDGYLDCGKPATDKLRLALSRARGER